MSSHLPKHGQNLRICSQSFKIITQYGDMLVVRQTIQPAQQLHQQQHYHNEHQQQESVLHSQSLPQSQSLSQSHSQSQSQSQAHSQQQTSGQLQHSQSQSAANQQQSAANQHQRAASLSASTASSVAPAGPQDNSSAHHKQQAQGRPVIMTFHDLGLNSELQFATFCQCDEVKLMLQTFTLIHVNFIGQEFDSQSAQQQPAGPHQSESGLQAQEESRSTPSCCESLPEDFKYPTVEQLAECIVDICAQMRVRSFIGLAVGAGAHIVSSLALLRPDLVHGLFLINPITASCSITEWLYFKMSAIASNRHHALAAAGLPSGEQAQQSGEQRAQSSAHCQSQADSQAQSQSHAQVHSHAQQPSGLRRLWSHLHHQQAGQRQSAAEEAPRELPVADAPRAQAAHGSRLRQLILSRNFKTSSSREAHPQHPQQQQQQAAPQSAPSCQGAPEQRPLERAASCSSAAAAKPAPAPKHQRRPPLEYLMYHHFGSAAAPRYRRTSDGASGQAGQQAASAGGRHSSAGSAGSRRNSSATTQSSSTSRRSSAAGLSQSSLAFSSPDEPQGSPAEPEADQALSSPARPPPQTRGARATRARKRLERASSISLTASRLASFASERQRVAYMQSVYRHYFQQLNAHNLWLFAQSFVKRRTLNLRKDCGAAAHAAAAAAALGTSICAAFVGAPSDHAANARLAAGALAQPPPGQVGGARPSRTAAQTRGSPAHTLMGANTVSGRQTASASASASNSASTDKQAQPPKQQQALVAGTKVKRTFTCQTLIMCSSVQMHCERSLKLMSLLNPLQATWIKTDQLLVLEEKPEKVCQALRLFLQGIGYSMSTYERRLRLSSAQASVSSADSSGSARSLNTLAAPSTISMKRPDDDCTNSANDNKPNDQTTTAQLNHNTEPTKKAQLK